MKKKVNNRDVLSGQQSADYVVGQVSGSLFQKNSSASRSLSALFSSPVPAMQLLFKPAPLPVQKRTESNEQESPKVKGQPCQKKKPAKEKSAANLELEKREDGLQKADEDEEGQETPMKKRKRKASESGRDNDAEYWVMKRQRLKASRVEEALKKKRTVFVGNLPTSCTKKTLRHLFRDGGSIESIRFRSVVREDPSMSCKVAAIKRKVHPKKQSINAYVVFKDEDGVTKALERNGMEVEKDFYIRVDRVTDSSSHDHKRSVFVGNLPFDINELAFRRHFEECGTVEAVRLVRDKNSGLGKGFGYVLFESADSVQLALKLEGSKLEGRSIRVKRSMKKEKEKNNSDSKATTRKVGKIPKNGSGSEKGAGRGSFKSPKKVMGNQQKLTKSSTSFKGEMADPNKKNKKKGLKKKKVKSDKSIHI
ncbi:RNA-binding protein 34 isoform X2 [Archocentrus centrarchus]|uniref:RNA-binding protein 34 isoform X2 n=1 Tax=Archocentrus centrarchus TaxID=63155 RepID=UPI0011EA1E2A|nr:RNA-binding protein 34 isoform X2 [Archocentrus centrarchus]